MKVFISYAPQDKKLAEYLSQRLSKKGFEVWRPEEQILPGENWALKYGQALEDSDAMIVLVSPEALRSRGVREEIQYALSSMQYADRVIPVVVRPTRKMPWFLRKLPLLSVGKSRTRLSQSLLKHLREIESN
ncbi:MAG: toll/interleukin-1 receptor domain-containing protein [Planctomycetota bacterium]